MAQVPNGFSAPMIKYPILSQLGLLNERNFADYIRSYPSMVKDSYIMKLEASGALKRTGNKKFRQYIDTNKPMPSFQVTADVSGSAGAAVTVTLTPTSHTGGGTLSPPAVGFLFEDDATGIEYEVRAVNKNTNGAHTATIAPTNTGTPAAITAATSFFKWQGRPSVIEASQQQDGIYSTHGYRERDLSIYRTNKSYSDLAKFEELEMNNQTFYTIDKTNIETEHRDAMEMGLMMGPRKNNLTAAAGNMNTDAEGMIPQIQRWGTDLTGSTSLSDAFFQDLKRMNDADGFTTEYEVLADTEFEIAYQNYLDTKTSSSNIVLNVDIDQAKREIHAIFDFSKTVQIYGQKISVKTYGYLNSSRTHGATIGTGHRRGTAIFIPQGNIYVDAADAYLPHVRVRYMADEGGPINAFDTDGALVGKNTKREVELALTSYKGLEMYGMEAFKHAKIIS